MVRTYVKAGGKRQNLAILGANAKRLHSKGVPDDLILDAVREFARTKRWPHYLREWVGEVRVGREIDAHNKRKAQERIEAPRVLAALAKATGLAFGWKRIPPPTARDVEVAQLAAIRGLSHDDQVRAMRSREFRADRVKAAGLGEYLCAVCTQVTTERCGCGAALHPRGCARQHRCPAVLAQMRAG